MNIITAHLKIITFGIGIAIFLPLGDAIRPGSIFDSHELFASGLIHLDSGKLYYLGFVNEDNIFLGAGGIDGIVVAHVVLSYNIP
jgi:hypothetical protein